VEWRRLGLVKRELSILEINFKMTFFPYIFVFVICGLRILPAVLQSNLPNCYFDSKISG